MNDSPNAPFAEWTESPKKRGLDPLGMQNSSIQLYQTLLPGISNVTLRLRYYGFYAWVARSYARRIGHTDPKRWQRFVCRAEALYALIAARRGSVVGIAGINWAQSALAAAPGDTIDFGPYAEPGNDERYLKNAWGAFGAAYRSQLFEAGILQASDDHEIPLPSDPTGEELADSFEHAVGGVADLLVETIERGSASLDELDGASPALPTDILTVGKEPLLYQSFLFRQNEQRSLTLVLVLKVAELLGHFPSADEVRWVLYAGCDQTGQTLVLDDAVLREQRNRWRVYHANDLCQLAYAALLKYALDVLEPHAVGLSLDDLIARTTLGVVSARKIQSASWAAFVDDLEPPANAYAPHQAASEYALATYVLRAGTDNSTVCSATDAAAAIHLLATLHRRIRQGIGDLRETLPDPRDENFHSLLTELHFFDQHQEDDLNVTLQTLLAQRVVGRHLWVAMRKLRQQADYTFLIETDNGRVRVRAKDGPVYTNPRLDNAITFLADCHLLNDGGLTEQGLTFARA